MRGIGWIVGLGLCGALVALPACNGDSGSSARTDSSRGAATPASGSASPPAATPATTSATTPAASSAPPSLEGTTSSDRAQAEQLFMARCAACHGKDGRGDGPGSLGLDPKPQNYTDPTWQTTVTNEEIEKAIVYGGAAVGKSPQMVSNPDLQAKPGVVTALRMKIRKFGQQ